MIIPKAIGLFLVLSLAAAPQPSFATTGGDLSPLGVRRETRSGPDSQSPATQLSFDFSSWHLPLPAGKWGISRGPCNSGARFSHDCRYYEERCGVDLVPLSGSMENVPVLAPQAGQIFFMGTRTDAGLMLMLRHADGRVSVFMHLAQLAVGSDESVAQGQVIAYAGSTGSSGNPHLHFVVQPSAVERECVDLRGLDELHYAAGWAVSKNLAWQDLALPDPPSPLPGWLPTLALSPTLSAGQLALPARLELAPGAQMTLPVSAASGVDGLQLKGFTLKPAPARGGGVLFSLPLTSPSKAGEYTQTLQPMGGVLVAGPGVALRYTVRPAPDTRPGANVILINPTFVSPANLAVLRRTPQLCWSEDASAGKAPLHFRAMVVGAASADSGWISATCWQPPNLKPGTYSWKVFVRDAHGSMNRTNQRPLLFTVR